MALRRRISKKRAPRRLRRKGGRKGKSSVPRGITTSLGQVAKCIETIAFQDILPGVQTPDSFNLMAFSRARYLACAYMYYKAAKCTWTYEPLFNTYASDDGVGISDTIPYIYTAMNRTGDAVAPNNLVAMQAMGGKPVKFNKKFVVSYVPNWSTPGLPVTISNSETGDTKPVVLGSKPCYGWINSSPYLSRNNVGTPSQNLTGELIPLEPPTLPADLNAPSYVANSVREASYSVMYNGHNAIFDQKTQISQRAIGRLTLTVEWHFRAPIWLSQTTQGSNL